MKSFLRDYSLGIVLAASTSVAWLAVVLGSFVLNLVILIAITGG